MASSSVDVEPTLSMVESEATTTGVGSQGGRTKKDVSVQANALACHLLKQDPPLRTVPQKIAAREMERLSKIRKAHVCPKLGHPCGCVDRVGSCRKGG